MFGPNRMWSAIVDRVGTLCSVIVTGDAWPGSRSIAIAKATTANGFSNDALALSTANLYAPTQPGGSLYGLNDSNPFNPRFQPQGTGIGFVPGGIITFGGGVARRLIVQAKPGSKWEPLVFAGTARSVTFTSIVPMPAAGFPTQRADVELVVDAAQRLLLRWTPHFHAINVGRPPPAVTTEILDGIDRLELSYWQTRQGGGWTSIWQNEAPPALVRIRIIFSNPSHGKWPDILVAPMLEPP